MDALADRRLELSDFLRTRRAKVAPSDVGLPDGARRRTPGLRREEVALLANIGATWYTRLEQGLPINVSADVLEGISRALRLTSEERRHLYVLAGAHLAVAPREEETVSELVLRTLEALNPCPAYIRGRRWDVLAYNRAADALSDFSSATGKARNVIWRLFNDPGIPYRLGDPECMKRRAVANFRAVAAKYPNDPQIHGAHRRAALYVERVSRAMGTARRDGRRRGIEALHSSRTRGTDSRLHGIRAPR